MEGSSLLDMVKVGKEKMRG